MNLSNLSTLARSRPLPLPEAHQLGSQKIHVSVHDRVNGQQVKACAAILDSLSEWFGDAETVSAYLNALPNLETYLARRDGKIVGFAALKRRGSHVAEIHVMGVARKERRRGIGTALVRQIVEDLARTGVRLLGVQTLSSSETSRAYAQTRAFYEAMGFLLLLEFRQEGWTDPTLFMARII